MTMTITLSINGLTVEVPEGSTILDGATQAGIYIPTLCWQPDIADHPPPEPVESVYQGEVERKGSGNGASYMGCDLCVVQIEGKEDLAHSCWMKAEEGMAVLTESDPIKERRRAAFATIMAEHPRACLSCRQKAGCSREPCSLDVPRAERCCPMLGRCQVEMLFDHLEFSSPLPAYSRDERLTSRSALFAYDWNLCVGCLRCVRVCGGLRDVGALGYVMDGGIPRIGFRTSTPEEGVCRFCGSCAEVCPTGTIMDLELHWTERDRFLVPCRHACPAGIDVPRYVRAVAQGKPDVAARVIRDTVPFGRTLGRVCHAPCQDACRRSALNDPVSICALKRYACDTVDGEKPECAPSTGKRVAVVGSGPAGLAAAWFLTRKGHQATVFEEQTEAGGMLRWGIPSFRLSRDVVQRDIEEITHLGVEIRTSTRVEDLSGLEAEFDAVLVATGLPRSKRLEIPGIDGERVWQGLEFLREVRSGAEINPGDRVVVIGGGNVAIDCALTARRLGAEYVTAVCLESYREMPSFDWEVREAQEEGVQIRNSWGPIQIEENGSGKRITFRQCVSVFDEEGRFAPRFDDSKRMELEADGIISAIGQQAAKTLPGFADAASDIFVAGDCAGGPFSIVNAIASGKAAAAGIDKRLGGDGGTPKGLAPEEAVQAIGPAEGFAGRRGRGPSAPKGHGFKEIEPAYGPDEALREAARCLQCDLRLTLSEAPLPPARVQLLEVSESAAAEVPAEEGVLQIYGVDREPLQITGTANLREELQGLLSNDRASYFTYQVDPYYTKLESELLQAHLQKHGAMPPGLDDMDDLFQ